MRLLTGLATHGLAMLAGFAGGIYVLPILTAQPAPGEQLLAELTRTAAYHAEFRRELKGSDALHWGEGRVSVGRQAIGFAGRIAPGPDYRLYLSPQFVEDEASFEQHRADMLQVGEVRSFGGFVVELAPGVDIERYTTVIVWCESFGEFITAARYR